MIKKNKVYLGDCFEVLKNIPDGCIDLVIADPPYGTMNIKWDNIIPIGKMWEELKRVIKPKTTVCIFGVEPFSSMIRMSNLKMYKYDWIWQKNTVTNFLNAYKQPMRKCELINIFYKQQCIYKPQMEKKDKKKIRNFGIGDLKKRSKLYNTMLSFTVKRKVPNDLSFPTEILNFKKDQNLVWKHPTQKPVALIEYLIRTYTEENQLVLDFCAGSGTTGVACQNLKREYILIEKNKFYFEQIKKRLENNKEK